MAKFTLPSPESLRPASHFDIINYELASPLGLNVSIPSLASSLLKINDSKPKATSPEHYQVTHTPNDTDLSLKQPSSPLKFNSTQTHPSSFLRSPASSFIEEKSYRSTSPQASTHSSPPAHPESTPKLHRCNYPNCTKSYTRKYNLLSHQLSAHSNSRPYSCEICKASFSRTHDLRRHTRSLHSNERPYKCHHCDLTFARSDALKRHLDRDMNSKKGSNFEVVGMRQSEYASGDKWSMPIY